MKVYLGLGSNKEDRRAYLQKAVQLLQDKVKLRKCSAVYETPAQLPENISKKQHSLESWHYPFLNMVLEVQCSLEVEKLLAWTQSIEQKLGRKKSEKWSPREIDIDILSIEGRQIQKDFLSVPHPRLKERDFVLSPWRDIAPLFEIDSQSVLSLSRGFSHKMPAWMDIFNLTPDSFSDGGQLWSSQESFIVKSVNQKIRKNIQCCVQWLDVGGFSTRPGAVALSAEEEWKRIQPFFQVFKSFSHSFIKVSVDTFRAEVARKALSAGAVAVNDVSGLSDPEMISLLKDSDCEYILMHSLSVPADKALVLDPSKDAVKEIKIWLEEKLSFFNKNKIDLSRVIFDPGIGFGKTSIQSLEIIQRLEEFMEYPVRLMVGHSRKSFMSLFSKEPAQDRSFSSLGISMQLAQRGVDILRVHKAYQQAQAWLAFKHTKTTI